MNQNRIIKQTEAFRPKANYAAYPPYHEGLYIEEYFFNFFTFENIKTDRIYLPIFWTNLYCNESYKKEKYNLQVFLDSLDPNASYFTICQHEAAPKEILPKNTLIFSASGKIHEQNKSNNHIAIPLICSRISNPNINKKRDILCSFVGASTHKLRTLLHTTYKDDPEFYFSVDSWKPIVSKEKEEEFKDITERSIFTLCPRGDGPNSFRLYEAMQLGSIPVYVHDMVWLPNEDEIDWKDICIFIKEGEIPHLKDILKHIPNKKIEKIRENIKIAYEKYFTLEKASEKIIEKLKNEKTRLVTFYSDSHEILFSKYFLPSVKLIDEYDLITYKTDQVGDGLFYNEKWKEATGKKLQYLIKSINECWGSYFVFSDVDIIFFRKTKEFLLSQIKNYDAVFQRDNKEICTGFFMIKCNEKTLNFIQTAIDNYEKYPEDQTALNAHSELISFKLLPNNIFNIGMVSNGKRWGGKTNLKIPKDILIFHSNWTVGIDSKIELTNYIIDELSDQIDYRFLKVKYVKRNCFKFNDSSFFIGSIRDSTIKTGTYINSNTLMNSYPSFNSSKSDVNVNVYINFFESPIQDRREEIILCLNKLNENKKIDKIILLCSDDVDIESDKIYKVFTNSDQPTFKDFFNIANFNTNENDINIILNSDCFIDEKNIQLIKSNITKNQVYCLSRWDIINIDSMFSKHYNIECSQDAWVFVGRVSEQIKGNYKLGMPGCDNAIAHEFSSLKYEVLNPSFDVKIFHIHFVNHRTYKEESRIKLPYLFVKPDKLPPKQIDYGVKITKIEQKTVLEIPPDMTGVELAKFKEEIRKEDPRKEVSKPALGSHGMTSSGGIRP